MKNTRLTSAICLPILTCAVFSIPHYGNATGINSIQDGITHTAPTLYQAVNASEEVVIGAQNFIENVSLRGLKFLQDKNLSHDARKAEFHDLLKDSFDLKTIGRFAMGRYWRQASEEQKKEYLSLFEEMVIDTYAKRFGEYQGQKIEIQRARPEGDKDAIVNSLIISEKNTPDVQLDWRVRYKGGEYRIVDVLVEGVSMTLTQRSEFSSIIQRGGGDIEALLQKLRER